MTRGAIWRQSWFGSMRVGKQPSPVLCLVRPTYFLKGHKIWDAVSINTSSEGKDLFCEFEHILLYSLAFLLLRSDVITHKNMAKGSSGPGIFSVTRQADSCTAACCHQLLFLHLISFDALLGLRQLNKTAEQCKNHWLLIRFLLPTNIIMM